MIALQITELERMVIPRHADGKPIISKMFGFSSMVDRVGGDPDWAEEYSEHHHNSWVKLIHLPTGAAVRIELPDDVDAAAAEQRRQYRNDPEGTPEHWEFSAPAVDGSRVLRQVASDEEEEVEPAHDYDGEIDF